jgi:hypothetical protein
MEPSKKPGRPKLYCSQRCNSRAQRRRNPERLREHSRKWRRANPDKNRERYKRNRERHLECGRKWRAKNLPKLRERERERARALLTRLTPIGEAICRTFASLPDTARAEYAGWVMFIALSDYRYMRVVGQWEVDDWLARYDAEIGDYLAGRMGDAL